MNRSSRFTRIPNTRRPAVENNPRFMKRGIVGLATTVLVSGGLALATLGPGAGTAQALPDGPYTWCPGQSKGPYMPQWGQPGPAAPGPQIQWDWSVCHTYYLVSWGQGNVDGPDRSIWDGDNPPGPAPQPWTPLPGL
jgi:hypothetical protein